MAFNPAEHMGDIKGKAYLEVKWRVVWFREQHPQGSIHTELIPANDLAIVRATIINGDGQVLATGHGTAAYEASNVVWKGRAIEKAETAAIGRALAHAGYGTQFTGDDEEDIVDSPVERKPTVRQDKPSYGNNKPSQQQETEPAENATAEGQIAVVTNIIPRISKANKPYYDLITTDGQKLVTWSRDVFRDVWNVGGWTENGKSYALEPHAEVHYIEKPGNGGRPSLQVNSDIPARAIDVAF